MPSPGAIPEQARRRPETALIGSVDLFCVNADWPCVRIPRSVFACRSTVTIYRCVSARITSSGVVHETAPRDSLWTLGGQCFAVMVGSLVRLGSVVTMRIRLLAISSRPM